MILIIVVFLACFSQHRPSSAKQKAQIHWPLASYKHLKACISVKTKHDQPVYSAKQANKRTNIHCPASHFFFDPTF